MEEQIALPEKLTRVYLKIRNKKAELAAAYKEQDRELTEQLDKIKSALLTYCKEQGVDSVKTSSGMFYRSVRSRYWTSDWESMHKFVMENNVPELLEKRLSQAAVKQYLEENPDSLPAGLNVDSEYIVSVRKSK